MTTRPPRVVTAFRIDPALLEGLREVQERDGVLVSEQVRRAIKAWLVEKGVAVRADTKRTPPRKRS